MLTLSALPHNITQRFGQVDRLYPIGLWFRTFLACVRRDESNILPNLGGRLVIRVLREFVVRG